MSFCNENGDKPGKHTFNFNMKFDPANEVVSKKSIKYLRDNGTDFEVLKRHGCDPKEVICGLQQLFGNKKITWVFFQG